MRYLLFLLLTVPPIFNSALIAPSFFEPYRVPLYIISILASLPFLANRIYPFVKLPLLLIILFSIGLVAGEIAGGFSTLTVNLRQLVVYSSLFYCGYVGYLSYRYARKNGINAIRFIVYLHVFLFAYGIYTYFAQVYYWPELLFFLRPVPELLGANGEFFVQRFSGWASAFRAYSVWYEPSYSSIVLAAVLPLVLIYKNWRDNLLLLLFGGIFTFLTYSRASWAIYIIFVLLWFYFMKFKLPKNSLLVNFFLVALLPLPLVLQSVYISYGSDISSIFRFRTVMNGIGELGIYFLTGLGTPRLVDPYVLSVFESSTHIHNSFVSMLHWVGLLGVSVLLLPLFFLVLKVDKFSRIKYQAVFAFATMTIIALSIGGNLVSLSTFWFFWGFYYAIVEDDRHEIVKLREASC